MQHEIGGFEGAFGAGDALALDGIRGFAEAGGVGEAVEDAAQAGVFAPSGVDFSAPFQHHAGIME